MFVDARFLIARGPFSQAESWEKRRNLGVGSGGTDRTCCFLGKSTDAFSLDIVPE